MNVAHAEGCAVAYMLDSRGRAVTGTWTAVLVGKFGSCAERKKEAGSREGGGNSGLGPRG